MLAILRDQGLEKHIEKTAEQLKLMVPGEPTKEEMEAMDRWKEGDIKAHTRIELSVGNSEMIHLSGAVAVRDMWSQLSMVKEVRGRLGVSDSKNPIFGNSRRRHQYD